MPIITLLGIPSSEPAPSHGGPMLGITWTLRMNGVELASERTRIAWPYALKDRQAAADSRNAPYELRKLEAAIKESLK